MVAYTTTFESQLENSAPLVISFPGPLHEDGRIVNAPTLSGIDSKIPDIGAELSQRTGRPVHSLTTSRRPPCTLPETADGTG